MATATHTTRDFEAATEQATRFGERLVDAGKRTGHLYLDNYEKFVGGVTEVQLKLADQSGSETVKSLASTQVALARDLAAAYTGVAREVLS